MENNVKIVAEDSSADGQAAISRCWSPRRLPLKRNNSCRGLWGFHWSTFDAVSLLNSVSPARLCPPFPCSPMEIAKQCKLPFSCREIGSAGSLKLKP
ncbi:GM23381 [Drosophila sechellia]|uniref:GM23381 n=1 Tax=Drosophila sechellia TaxID=7238 RepID=B4ILW2_DROSE|nr:GM23381 [Drosophila sechellia]